MLLAMEVFCNGVTAWILSEINFVGSRYLLNSVKYVLGLQLNIISSVIVDRKFSLKMYIHYRLLLLVFNNLID